MCTRHSGIDMEGKLAAHIQDRQHEGMGGGTEVEEAVAARAA